MGSKIIRVDTTILNDIRMRYPDAKSENERMRNLLKDKKKYDIISKQLLGDLL